MSAPFTETPIVGYNSNPPPNDGTEVTANTVNWDNHINKIGDPIKNYVSANLSNVSGAFSKVIGGNGVTSVNSDYQVLTTDQGKAVTYTASGGHTVTTPDATIVGSPFVFAVVNTGAGDLTLDGYSSQTINGSADNTIASGQGGFVFTDGSNWFLVTSPTVPAPTGSLADPVPGFSYSGTTDLVFEDMDCPADDSAHTLMTGNALTKDVSSTFVAGDGNGCLDTGTLAQGWYAVFAIAESATSLDQDFLISLSSTSPTMPGGYTLKRRIGWIYVNASLEIRPFAQTGNDFWHDDDPGDDYVGSNPGAGGATITLSAPPSTKALVAVTIRDSDFGISTGKIYATSATSGPAVVSLKASSGTLYSATSVTPVDVDTSGQVTIASSGTPTAFEVNVIGWTDRRGRDG